MHALMKRRFVAALTEGTSLEASDVAVRHGLIAEIATQMPAFDLDVTVHVHPGERGRLRAPQARNTASAARRQTDALGE